MRRTLLSLSALLLIACAVVQPPPGGPEDTEPPHVRGIFPAADSTGVARDAEIAILFSEKVDGESFKERVKLYPPVPFEGIRAKGDELRIRFAEALPETTLTLLLSAGYRDLHKVQSRENRIFHFSTTEQLQDGMISGWILFKGKGDSTGVARLFQVLADSAIAFKVQPESRVAFASREGSFQFRALPTDSARFIIWAFSDKNGDGVFAEQKEFFLLHPDTIVLTERSSQMRDIRINIIDPMEPGIITGKVIDETGLGRVPTVRLAPVLPGEPVLVVAVDSTGYFNAQRVPPGRYTVSVFIDVTADSLCGSYVAAEDSSLTLEEPCLTLPDTLVMEPGGKVEMGAVTLEGVGYRD